MKGEMVKRTFIFAYFTVGIAQLCEIGFNFLLYTTFAVNVVGVYAWAAAVIVFFNMTVDLGVEPVLTRKFGTSRPSLKNAYIATYIPRLPILLVGLSVIVFLFAQDYLDAGRFWLLLLIGGQSIFNMSDGVCKAWLRTNSLQTHANAMAAGIGVLKLLAILFLTQGDNGTILELMALLLVVRALISASAFATVQRRSRRTVQSDGESLSQLTCGMLKSGLVIGGIGLLTAVQNRFDWLLVSYFVSTNALAGYSLANKFYEVSQVIVGASMTTVYPWLCRFRESSPTLNVILRMVVAIGALMGVLGAACGPWLIGVLFGDKYADAEFAAMILMVAVGLMTSSGVFYQVLLANGLESSLLRVTAVTTVLQAICNVLLIQVLGITGAAIGMLLLVLMTTSGLSYLVLKRRIMERSAVLRILVFITIYLGLAGVLAFWMPSTLISATLGGTLVVFVGWQVLFTRDEQKLLIEKGGEIVCSFNRENLH
ncbi:oligosaccharide flippase family protein [Woeseia oceani]|uniref:Polysaccharide biosynthesis protein C-terminal domain-containing protein n=1 Tax=Woeseia oceani TaxID=1548547 RepID=A0A193LEH0_9GAMM|nr:oligosaccharide flippase family protein [Woeseia oceani]ANO50925.1 hypothetical protein BA177_06645 [Woeseia oceani]